MRKLEKDELTTMIRSCNEYNARKIRPKEGYPTCEKCRNKRWIQIVEDNEIKMAPCECQEKIRVYGNRRNWGGASGR